MNPTPGPSTTRPRLTSHPSLTPSTQPLLPSSTFASSFSTASTTAPLQPAKTWTPAPLLPLDKLPNTNLRTVSEHKPVTLVEPDTTQYPYTAVNIAHGIQNLGYIQSLLKEEGNFVDGLSEVIETVEGGGVSRRWMGGQEMADWIEKMRQERESNSTPRGKLTVICPTLTPSTVPSSFNLSVSLTPTNALSLLTALSTTPHFVPHLLGAPDYFAPCDFATYTPTGTPHIYEFLCQHPRWLARIPWSIYLQHHLPTRSSTYILLSSSTCPYNALIKDRLSQTLLLLPPSSPPDPFLLHTTVAHESLLQSGQVATDLRLRLYAQIQQVDIFARTPSDRNVLRAVTSDLHTVSRDADSNIASCEMGIMVGESLQASYRRFVALATEFEGSETGLVVGRGQVARTEESLGYLVESLRAQRRWLNSYRTRKDIAMNLVFNLVTQQDSETNTVIATETKRDSASMKTISMVTMAFLPGTFVSSIFGMCFFEGTAWGRAKEMQWVYFAVTLPLTALTVLVYLYWGRIVRWFHAGVVRDGEKAVGRDEEKGVVMRS